MRQAQHGGGDVVGVRGVGDRRRPAVDRAVPGGARGVVAGVGRLDQAPDEAGRAERPGEGEIGDGCHAPTLPSARRGGVGVLPICERYPATRVSGSGVLGGAYLTEPARRPSTK